MLHTRKAARTARAPSGWGGGADRPPPTPGAELAPPGRITRCRMAAAARAPGWVLRPVLMLLLLPPAVNPSREPRTAARLSLHPPYFNLAEAAKIWATATCGEREPGGARPELYCKLVGGPTAAGSGHTIQLFHVAYLIIKFANSPRPDLWVLERSVDFGSTYTPWQYFAHSKVDCLEQFGQEANMAITQDDDVLCTTEYSRIVPLENGEVVVSLINGRPGAKNFTFSHTLREFTKATNIRLCFLRTNTLLGHLISKAQRDPTVTRRYYYSIKDISIGGRCVCNGHAQDCNANNPEKLFQCECQHHTCGKTCDRCCAGYHQRRWRPATWEQSNECEACNCHGHALDCYYDPDVERQQASLNIHGIYAGGGVCINCQHNTAGINCENCAKGYYRPYGVPVDAPHGCIPCSCNPEHADDCEPGSGRCTCKPNFRGDNCEKCAVGYYGFPFCLRIPIFPISTPSPEDPVAGDIKGCDCDLEGVLPEICDAYGRCLCRPGVEGHRCDACRLGFYSFPICQACQCSVLGSYQTPCNPVTGQCECLPGVTGQRCDRCLSGAYDFPHCQDFTGRCDPAGTLDSNLGYCQCKAHVESPSCSICKPLYWNLAKENPNGCSECRCHVAGTVSGIGECGQRDGDCHCKSHVSGDSCDTCEDGYFALEKSNYFGCQGCQCDVGGAISPLCSGPSGGCRCREHVVGTTCQRPENNYYFPDLHHMKYEIEDGTTPNGKELRFGFDPLEFPEFSWRGYAQMTSVQNEVRIMLNVGESSHSLFRVILKYINPGTEAVSGRVTIYPSRAEAGAAQSKEVIFLPRKEPAFVTVPGNGVAEQFSIAPGTWIACIKSEGVLLDYLVLLPRDYYEASSLQLPVTQPCADSGPLQENCLLYQHLPVTRFPCALACEARHFLLDGEPRALAVRQPTPAHPVMADLSGREVELYLRLRVPQVGNYVVVLQYSTEVDQLSVVDVHMESPGSVLIGQVNIYSCKYSVLCRSVVTDGRSRLAVYELLTDAGIRLKARRALFLLHQICIIPIEEFSTEYLRPQVKCIASYGGYVNQSASCVSLVPETPPTALILDVPSGESSPFLPQDPLPSADVTGVVLKVPQNEVTLRGLVPRLGRYVIVIHFYQPAHPAFPTQVFVDGGRPWPGVFRASFCPHVLGCRDQVIAEDQVEFDISKPEVAVTLKVPEGKSLVLVRVLVVPAEDYDYQRLHKKSVDKSFEFINSCGRNSFYIDPQTASGFCKNSARSLVALYHKGALPCECHPTGAIGHHCSPEGGQCPCRPSVIGRQCTRCRMGYYGFPHCKPCNCGPRLCEEMTGKCLCPPRTVRPQCEACDMHSFSFHPLAGCEGCNCSRRGTVGVTTPECNRDHGQCRCKPRVTGRQCDWCASGFYHFPECLPCHCNRDGTEPGVCDPGTGACLCKENVAGTECNVCREGSFYLDPANPKGCTRCFCFGISNHCHSTHKRRAKFVDMMGWRLETADGTDIPVSFNPGSSSVVADLQELPSTVHSASWVAPLSYLGDKVSSYGGYLTYQIKSFGLPGDMVLLEKMPDVQFTGQHMSIVYKEPSNPRPDRLYHVRVQVVEGNFRHASSSGPVTREEMMMVLSSLEDMRLRGLYFTETQRLSLSGVGLEEASDTGSGRRAHNVEMCACPPHYTGDSCQGCSPGYYRDNEGPYTRRCVPCNCNGHSSRCQDGSGICINCQHNTAGEHCERCKEGHYGNALQGSCRVCPCPHSNSFATGCVVNGGNIRCFCKPGYTGTQCERCAPGYFGNPQKFGGSCQPCNCNSNGHPGSCHPLTGDCLNQEPKDGDTGEECDDCDSCVMTLLSDLAAMGNELHLVKSQLHGLSTSTGSLEQMKHLETQIKDLRNQLYTYRSAISNHGLKMDGLEKELGSLNHEFETLQEKVQVNSRKAQALHNNVDRTIQSAKELDTKIKNVIQNVHILVKQISGTNGEGNNLPPGDFSREWAEAEHMMRELRNRDFGKQLTKAEAEKREAQLLLTRIKSWLEQHQGENSALVKSLRDSFHDYEAKLSDLRAMLQKAAAQAKQATGLNRENEKALESIKTQVQEMNSLRSDLSKYLATADSSLLQTKVLLQQMGESQEEYEKSAATIKEERHRLSDKVRELSRSASKASLVVEAEAHAQSLQELAKQLEEIKRNTSGNELVRCAVDAATAYENILNAIKAAEDAANKATSASESALQTVIKEDLPGKAKTLSSDSDKLLKEAKITQKQLQQEISPALNNLQQTLKVLTVQKGLIDTNITAIRDDLRGIQRDDVSGMISSAKSMVRNANDITNEVLDGLGPIQADVTRIKDTYGSTQREDFNKALTDADNSVKKLTNKLPDLLSKIESINEQLLPLGNISDNVDRIRELIQQARDAANKVAVPMRFNGKSGVEVRVPNDLEDLKGYTSLSLFLQRPDSGEYGKTESMFVMYLGNKDASKDYIGMAVIDGKLSCVYNLGEQESELQVDQSVTKSETQEAVMDRVKFQRIYQFASLNYTKKATSIKPGISQFHEMGGGSSHTLLNLDPENVVFYVGGYPPDFILPARLSFPPYKGCIELDDLNENVLSLYNFKQTFNLNTTEVEPCRRRKEESEKNYFEGTGYARVPSKPNAPIPNFRLTIQTTMDRGLLFFAENKDHFISLNIEDGKLLVRYKLNSEPPKEKEVTQIVNNGKECSIQIKIGKDRKVMTIYVGFHGTPPSLIHGDIFDFSIYYLGGIPISIRERFNISTPAFRGCMTNLKKTSGVVRLNDTVGVTKKCSEDWKLVRSASFSRGGQLRFTDLDLPLPNEFQASFGFQTFQPSGMLFNLQAQTRNLQISLEDGHIELNTRDSNSPIFKSPQTYTDGSLHYVSVISDNSGLRLLIDDQTLKSNQRLQDLSGSQHPLYLGGSHFEGCISNVFIRRQSESPAVLDLTSKTFKRDVSLGGCSLNPPPFLLLLRGSPRLNKSHTFNINQPLQDTPVAFPRRMEVWREAQSCLPPPRAQASHGALRFGDRPTSHLLFTIPQELVTTRSRFAVDVQTVSSRGLVFFTGTPNSYMALYLSKGRLVFALGADGKKLKLKSKEKCNDGQWHTVVFGQDGEKGHLVVDGLRAREGSLPGNSTVTLRAPVYLGSSPSGKPKSLPQNSFVGCLRNFQLDQKPLDTPSLSVGVSPCLGGSLEKGIYFSQEGGHVILANSVLLGPEFKLVFSIRPRSLTGILIHIGSRPGRHLCVYLEAGKVKASVDSEAGGILASVTPKRSLCDGRWHSVTVTIKQHILHLELDAESSYTAGRLPFPPADTREPLHIGGVPAGLKTLKLPVWESFFGCLKNIQVNHVPIPVTEALDIQGTVNLSGCPHH
ncbi:laminin subunit alpha-3 isoform X2 [Meles meles]|uniref:laminin subunit alpha-3 isoform X2 n=1 Tax=Meles meles TaxID=9662 RepID=UPI001E698A7C|nr:laminin subunit alpha-3 isoform X2 [Meles meles]